MQSIMNSLLIAPILPKKATCVQKCLTSALAPSRIIPHAFENCKQLVVCVTNGITVSFVIISIPVLYVYPSAFSILFRVIAKNVFLPDRQLLDYILGFHRSICNIW